MSAADLIAMGVEVLAEDPEMCRPFAGLGSLIREGREEADGLREVLAMLRDASDAAIDAHPNAMAVTRDQMRRFSEAMNIALGTLA